MAHFHTLDLVVIGLYLAFALSMGPIFYRLAKRSTTDFFLSGRELPWWLSGTSMVATTFGAGTPLLVCGFIWANGVFMNWWWWSFALSNVMTVVFFARLWRRSKVTTDAEFSELRYGGRAGAWLRGFRALYFGGLVNIFIKAWLMFSAFGIVATLIGADPGAKENLEVWFIILAIVGLVTLYSSLAGLWGVVTTDVVQFLIATVSCIYLAVVVVDHLGGMAALETQVVALHPLGEGVLQFFPTPEIQDIPWIMLTSFFLAQWWCSYYPGSEPGGGAYVAQRMLASRTEKHAQLATLWFSVAHYAIRPWPWIVVGLATVVLYPQLVGSEAENAAQLQELTYIQTIIDFLPAGWKGAMVRAQGHFVAVSRLSMALSALVAVLVAVYLITSLGNANRFLVGLMAGIGLVFALRFYWWRVNAWSEISAMTGAVVINGILQFWVAAQAFFKDLTANASDRGALLLMAGALLVNALWIIVTLKTAPESREVLHRFYLRVRPPGPGWRKIARECGVEHEGIDPRDFLAFLGGIMLIWGALYAVGKLLFAAWLNAFLGLAVTLVGGLLLYKFLIQKADRADLVEGERDASEREVMDE